jgi:glycosyltransferase involved in cell wall biosynthesis
MKEVRLLIFIVAYNAEKTIRSVLSRIPKELTAFETEVLIIDDASVDNTWETAETFKRETNFPFKLTVLANPVNQGYGGNQKLGFLYAIQHKFDLVALVHGDGQYAPEALPELIQPILEDRADAVFGSRMISVLGALKGGMPVYKYVGNRILTAFQNLVLRTSLSEFHSGYRIYSVKALSKLPFSYNTNQFHFDTEIIIQLLFASMRIKELSIPTYYGNEICHVNGLKYAWDVVVATVIARLQSYCLLYRRNFDVQAEVSGNYFYMQKLDYDSPHSYACKLVPPRSRVVDLGCATGYLSGPLRARGCAYIGVDKYEPANVDLFDEFIQHDLNDNELPVNFKNVDYILMLDIIEHLAEPEKFARTLRAATSTSKQIKIIISTGNIAFIVQRLMLLLGQFNYGKKGILDLTHTRLFTFATLATLLKSHGFEITQVHGIPAPFPMVIKSKWLSQLLLALNTFLIAVSKTLFSYQMLYVATPLPTLDRLLDNTREHTDLVRERMVSS